MTAELSARAGAALGALGARYGLGDGELARLRGLLETLQRSEHAPTSVSEAEQAVDIHIADSLVALELGVPLQRARIAEVGAGAGFPGLALAAVLPAAAVWLIESNERKCRFMLEAIAAAGIGNARVECVRAEAWDGGIEANDVVLARALAPQPVVLEYAAPLLRIGGTLLDWRGRLTGEQEAAAARAAEVLGMRRERIRAVDPFPGAVERHIHVFAKVARTPSRFPRRPGMARKRPLG